MKIKQCESQSPVWSNWLLEHNACGEEMPTCKNIEMGQRLRALAGLPEGICYSAPNLGSWQLPVTPVPGALMPCNGLHEQSACLCTHALTHTHTHTQWRTENIFFHVCLLPNHSENEQQVRVTILRLTWHLDIAGTSKLMNHFASNLFSSCFTKALARNRVKIRENPCT